MKLTAIKQGNSLQIQENIDIPDGEEITIVISQMPTKESLTAQALIQNIFKLFIDLPSELKPKILEQIEAIDYINNGDDFLETLKIILLDYQYQLTEKKLIEEIELDSNMNLESEDDIINLAIKLTE